MRIVTSTSTAARLDAAREFLSGRPPGRGTRRQWLPARTSVNVDIRLSTGVARDVRQNVSCAPALTNRAPSISVGVSHAGP